KTANLPEIHILPGVNLLDQSINYAVSIYRLPFDRVFLMRSGSPVDARTDFGKEFDFAIEVLGQRVTVRVNGKAVIRDELVEEAQEFGRVGLWIERWTPRAPASVTISGLTIQKV